MTEPIPDDSMQRRTWLIAAVLALVVLLVGVGVAFGVMALRKPAPKAPVAFTPAEESTPSVSATASSSVHASSSVAASAGVVAPVTTGGSAPSASASSGHIVRAARIAYRLDGQVWVAGEDGSSAKAVANSSMGAFSLSPDGKTLVLMEGPTETAYAVLIDVETGVRASLTRAVDLPVWSPDSSWLAYTAGGSGSYSVRRVDRDGTGDALLIASAAAPAISADGKRVAYTRTLPSQGATQAVLVYDIATNGSTSVPSSLGAQSFAFAPGGALYFAKGRGDRSLWVASADLSHSSAVAPMPAGTEQQTPGDLYPNPAGTKVLFALTGDDGYSRIVIADVPHKALQLVQMVKDATPDGWSVDGARIFYIFGNAFQNETTALYRMNADGTHRAIVVNGASL